MKIFIDGREGTTGLQIEQRLREFNQVELLTLTEELRKDSDSRKKMLNSADVVFLCLPDVAAKEAVSWIENPNVVVFDASTAHRTHPSWVYGFPELSSKHEQDIKASNRIAIPGCYASGFCGLVYPLIQKGVFSKDTQFNCNALSGYSGAGKQMIATYQNNPPRGARPYALGLSHKHLPEMMSVCGLTLAPIFQPVIVDVPQGMIVSVPLSHCSQKLQSIYEEHYEGCENIQVMPFGTTDDGFLEMEKCNDTNNMQIFIHGHGSQALVMARFDNLGKGASGAAVQCLKLRFGM